MNFKQLPIKKSYINQGTDNLVDGLLNPGLKLSVKYRRSVGFFSSSVFRLLLNSLPSFIQNRGVIQLIVSPSLSQDDINAIQLGYEILKFVALMIPLSMFSLNWWQEEFWILKLRL